MHLCDLDQRSGLGQQAFVVFRCRPAARGADQLVEHFDGKVGQRCLALDCERHQHRALTLRREAQQFASRRDAGLAGDDTVPVGMDRLPPVIGQSDPAQHLQARDDIGKILQLRAFRDLADPAVLRPLRLDARGQQCRQSGPDGLAEIAGQIAVGLPSCPCPAGEGKAFDQVRQRHDDAAQLQVFDNGANDRFAPLGRDRGPCGGHDRRAVVGLAHRPQSEQGDDLADMLPAGLVTSGV
jgi:hypothetical protein